MSEPLMTAYPVYIEDEQEAVIICTTDQSGQISIDVAPMLWGEED